MLFCLLSLTVSLVWVHPFLFSIFLDHFGVWILDAWASWTAALVP